MNVLVVGAAGQLGQAMTARLGREHDVTAWTRQDIDLTRHQDVREAIGELAPQAIVNCASFNQVDAAEDEQVTALDVNAMVVGTLARAAAVLSNGLSPISSSTTSLPASFSERAMASTVNAVSTDSERAKRLSCADTVHL